MNDDGLTEILLQCKEIVQRLSQDYRYSEGHQDLVQLEYCIDKALEIVLSENGENVSEAVLRIIEVVLQVYNIYTLVDSHL
ncbi:MAG TPA: hypothetical protein VD993_15445 [Chitinophagaceae bacterium]|nr:hypothetical protein [Chitinophagaceae bacterium]